MTKNNSVYLFYRRWKVSYLSSVILLVWSVVLVTLTSFHSFLILFFLPWSLNCSHKHRLTTSWYSLDQIRFCTAPWVGREDGTVLLEQKDPPSFSSSSNQQYLSPLLLAPPQHKITWKNSTAAVARHTRIPTCPFWILTPVLHLTPERKIMRVRVEHGWVVQKRVEVRVRVKAKECALKRRNGRLFPPPHTS